MSSLNKIIAATVTASYLTLVSLCLYGQDRPKHLHTKHNQHITVGFTAGRSMLYKTINLQNGRSAKEHYLSSHSLVLNKTISNHFKVEGGVSYFTNPGTLNKELGKYILSKPSMLTAPATLQYNFLPKKCRLQPYCGAGLQYNLNLNPRTISPFTNDSREANNTTVPQSGTKYISILFTQGVTFEINTKIQIRESFHFIPENNNKIIGIDLGFGYNIR